MCARRVGVKCVFSFTLHENTPAPTSARRSASAFAWAAFCMRRKDNDEERRAFLFLAGPVKLPHLLHQPVRPALPAAGACARQTDARRPPPPPQGPSRRAGRAAARAGG